MKSSPAAFLRAPLYVALLLAAPAMLLAACGPNSGASPQATVTVTAPASSGGGNEPAPEAAALPLVRPPAASQASSRSPRPGRWWR